ncbi:Benzoate--CoA ligase [Zhongshania aliphaticivorans]|uniref:Benzoate--CoA ligase n=1 Tax=Zhongshania aliphaticivorans TaxID=1470434 RepID=A0A5S9P671_9GAMM|nr:AMP-binding protein [Zhongshania aliphaticivorans]CAA0091582.1 Benzoate--CoA ligase [Zhongshania aliphaticivorans]CAA0098933.1 Benzoate--CoA ligase [Zhongshania aliphaticivorans]
MSVLKALRSLCETSAPIYSNNKIIAYRGVDPVLWLEIDKRIEHWKEHLNTIPESAIAVHQNSGTELLAVLVAIWQLKKVAVFPSSTRQNHLHTIICPKAIPSLDDTENFVLAAKQNYPLNPDLALIIYTSGSTGQAQPCPKTFSQLNAEIETLESCWKETPLSSLFASSVSRHHMYGLPFGLLWPFLRGNPFIDTRLPYLESLDNLPGDSFTLISSPVQLANLPVNLDTSTPSRCAAVFSAGAPLPSAAAERSQHHFGKAVIEIYGSTETGAIAQRQQTVNKAWQLLPNTKLQINDHQHIEISSPAAGCSDGDWLSLSDIGEQLDEQRFYLKGRDDQIVKVGAKRISLNSINDRLLAHPWICEARTILLNDRKSRIAAVICLNSEGNYHLTDKGRKSVNDVLLQHIDGHVESIAKPRYWRYLSTMPMNSQGKIQTEVLENLFFSERQPRLPELIAHDSGITDSCAKLTLFVPHQLFYFNGHFPGNPILPGVVQISWVMHFAKQQFSELGQFQRLEVIKFQKIIHPGDTIYLELKWDTDKRRLLFSYRNSLEQSLASGRIGFTHHD